MTVYVDPPRPPPSLDALDPSWPLLTTNGPLPELHDFARSIGVGPGWFSSHPVPCYALTAAARDRAAAAGARPALSLVRDAPAEPFLVRENSGELSSAPRRRWWSAG